MNNGTQQLLQPKPQPGRRIRFAMLLIALTGLGLAVLPAAQAVVINLTDASLFTPANTPVYAYHFYAGAPTGPVSDPGPYTIQGTTFQSFNLFAPPGGFSQLGTGFASTWSYYTTGNTPVIGAGADNNALEAMMADGTWFYSYENGNDIPESLTLVGLTPGTAYQVDLFALNSSAPLPAQDTQFTFNDGQTNHFTAAQDTYYDVRENVVANGSGQIVVDLTSPLGDYSVNFNGAPRLSAFAVSEDVIPEPSTLLLLGLGGTLFMWRRQRNAR